MDIKTQLIIDYLQYTYGNNDTSINLVYTEDAYPHFDRIITAKLNEIDINSISSHNISNFENGGFTLYKCRLLNDNLRTYRIRIFYLNILAYINAMYKNLEIHIKNEEPLSF